MRITRLPIQVIAMFLQIYFFLETFRLYSYGYVVYMGKPVENTWFSILFTLLVVVACEALSLLDSIIFISSKRNPHSYIYLGAIIINALLFMSLAYYSTVGTVVCIVFYALLFAFRIINLILNVIDIARR